MRRDRALGMDPPQVPMSRQGWLSMDRRLAVWCSSPLAIPWLILLGRLSVAASSHFKWQPTTASSSPCPAIVASKRGR